MGNVSYNRGVILSGLDCKRTLCGSWRGTQPCMYPLGFMFQWDSKNNWLWSGSPRKWEMIVCLTFISFCPGKIVTCSHYDPHEICLCSVSNVVVQWIKYRKFHVGPQLWVHSSCSCWYMYMNIFLWTFQGHNLEHWLVKVKAPLDDSSKLVGGGVVKLRTRVSWDSIS